MVVHNSKNKTTAKKMAKKFRKQGLKATAYDLKGKGWGVSVTRK